MQKLKALVLLGFWFAGCRYSGHQEYRRPEARTPTGQRDRTGTQLPASTTNAEFSFDRENETEARRKSEAQERARITDGYMEEIRILWERLTPKMQLPEFVQEVTSLCNATDWIPQLELQQPQITRSWTPGSRFPVFPGSQNSIRKFAKIGPWQATFVARDDSAHIGLFREMPLCTKERHDSERLCCKVLVTNNFTTAQRTVEEITAAFGVPTVSACRTSPGLYGSTDWHHSHQWHIGGIRVTFKYTSVFYAFAAMGISIQDANKETPDKRLEPLVYLQFSGKRITSGTENADEGYILGIDYNENKLLRQDSSVLADISVTEDYVAAQWSETGEDKDGTYRIDSDLRINRKTASYSSNSTFVQKGIKSVSRATGVCMKVDINKRQF